MKYIFAIDETGNFYSDNWSSVCGVLIKGNEIGLKQAYQNIYKEFGFPEPVPNDAKSLLTTNENINDSARFHFNKMNNSQKAILKKHLLPFIDRLFISQGKPSLFANNQNWWQIAVTVVIKEFLRNCKLEKGDEVEILIDNRNEKVFGVVDIVDFKDYHNNIKQQIENNVKRFIPNNNLKIEFKSDTSSFAINLADICCGIKESDELLNKKVVCKCSSMYDYLDPIVYREQNPFMSLNIIIQEIDNCNFKNLSYVEDILKRLRKYEDDYSEIWNIFYDFLKSKIEERKYNANLVETKGFVDIFLKEFNISGKDKIKSSQSLELMVLFTEYFSHIGDINIPFERKGFEDLLQKCDKDSETRLLRKWEKLVSYTLRESQIHFNAYDFNSANKNLEDIWDKHTNLLSALKGVLGEKDEPTTALLGSLAQSFAFNDNFNEALEYFELSKQYAIKSSSTTDSYIFTMYHKQENIEKCRVYFELMCGKTPEQYREDNEIGKVWTLVAYCKLRALELYKNKQTNLKAIDLQSFENYNSGYPFTLAMKWEAIALVLENGDKQTIEKYFSDAIGNMLNENNEFAIRTLTLSLIQCYGLVNNQNPYHSKYNTYLRDLKNSSKHFEKYVNEKSPLLNEIKNNADIWQRAIALPFYYA